MKTIAEKYQDRVEEVRKRKVPSKSAIVHVFDTNLRGSHNTASAKLAIRHYGAIKGRASGRQGNSYAIPMFTYDDTAMPYMDIFDFISEFFQYAELQIPRNDYMPNREEKPITVMFKIMPVGLSLPFIADIKSTFISYSPDNCILHQKFFE